MTRFEARTPQRSSRRARDRTWAQGARLIRYNGESRCEHLACVPIRAIPRPAYPTTVTLAR
jgi:hypothetical protein